MKALLDHFCCRWMVHRPNEQMFHKKAVVLANAVGVFTGDTLKDYKSRKGIKVNAKFAMCKMMHQEFMIKEGQLSADDQHWVDKGWIKR